MVSLRLVPKKDGTGRVPACEVLVNTAAVRDNIRDSEKYINIPELIKSGSVQYGMQSFDQSLMRWYKEGAISKEAAMYASTNASEFELRLQGIEGTSDQTFSDTMVDDGLQGDLIP